MKAVVIDKFVNTYSELSVSDIPRPQPKHDELLIQVKAAGVNFVDTLYARGQHQNNRRHMKPPFVLGLEFAGIITSVPSSSSSSSCPFRPGDRVFGDYSGAYAEYIVYPVSAASNLRLVPAPWSSADAAGLAATFPVSYGALCCVPLFASSAAAAAAAAAATTTPNPAGPDTSSKEKQSGKEKQKEKPTVLVHAAAGGLGLAAVQIARAAGFRVLGTAGSARKCRVAERFGCDVCVDYTQDKEWWRTIKRDLTNDQGVDIVYDSVGLVNDSLRCLAHRGTVLVVGFAGRNNENLESVRMNKVLLGQAKVVGYRFGESHRRYPEEKAQIWEALWPLMESRRIRPTVFDDVAYKGLDSVPRALDDIASRKVWGKAVIHVDGDDDAANDAAGNRPKL